MTGEKKTLAPSIKRHRQQMVVQVWLPLGLAIAVVARFGVLVVLAAGQSSPVVGQAANISLIYMLAPAIIFSLLYAVLIGLAIYLVAKIIHKVPSITRPVQAFLEVVNFKTAQFSSQAAQPIIKVRSIFAAFRRVMRKQ